MVLLALRGTSGTTRLSTSPFAVAMDEGGVAVAVESLSAGGACWVVFVCKGAVYVWWLRSANPMMMTTSRTKPTISGTSGILAGTVFAAILGAKSFSWAC